MFPTLSNWIRENPKMTAMNETIYACRNFRGAASQRKIHDSSIVIMTRPYSDPEGHGDQSNADDNPAVIEVRETNPLTKIRQIFQHLTVVHWLFSSIKRHSSDQSHTFPIFAGLSNMAHLTRHSPLFSSTSISATAGKSRPFQLSYIGGSRSSGLDGGDPTNRGSHAG